MTFKSNPVRLMALVIFQPHSQPKDHSTAQQQQQQLCWSLVFSFTQFILVASPVWLPAPLFPVANRFCYECIQKWVHINHRMNKQIEFTKHKLLLRHEYTLMHNLWIWLTIRLCFSFTGLYSNWCLVCRLCNFTSLFPQYFRLNSDQRKHSIYVFRLFK